MSIEAVPPNPAEPGKPNVMWRVRSAGMRDSQRAMIWSGFVVCIQFAFFLGIVANADLIVGGGGRGRGVQTSVGKGSIDWAKTFKAAKIGGVKNYFVEQNMELTKASVAAATARSPPGATGASSRDSRSTAPT